MTNKKRKKTIASSGSEAEVVEQDPVFENWDAEKKKLISTFERKLKTLMQDFEQRMAAKETEMSSLKNDLHTLKRKVAVLEDTVEDTDAYERRDTVVLSGSEVPVASDGENSVALVTDLISRKIGVKMKKEDISTAHRLGQKINTQAPDRRNIIVKLCRRDTKNDLLRACKTAKPANLYINENLTRKRNVIFYGLRKSKKKFPNIVAGCGTFDGKVYAWIKPPNLNAPNARNTKVIINSRDKFDSFCASTLKCDPSELVDNWPTN